MADAHRIFRSAFVISACTLLSRVLGLARDVLCARFFGDKWVFDAFSLAFRVPNLFRRLFGEGAASAAFIPVFTEYIEKRERADVWTLVSVSGTFLITVLAATVVVGELLFAGLHTWGPFGERGRLVLELLSIMFPYVLFICLLALCMAVLNSLDHFFSPAIAPVVLNVFWIAGVVLIGPMLGPASEQRIFGVAIAVIAGGVVQLAIQIPALRTQGVRFRLCFDFAHPGLRRVLRLMAPVIIGLAVMQINVLFDGLIAMGFSRPPGHEGPMTLLGWTVAYPMESGANSVLYYAERLMQFPLGVFGIAMATAALPTFCQLASRKDEPGLVAALNHTLRIILFIGIPASVGLVVMRRPIVELLYEHGAFTKSATARTSMVVLCYGMGVWAYCGVHVLVRAFHALQDTKTPVKVGASLVALNLCLNLTFIWFLREAGLAAATAISSSLQLVVLYTILTKRIGRGDMAQVLTCLAKTCAASVVMGAACVVCLAWLELPARTPADESLRVFVPIAVGGLAFLAASWALRASEFADILGALVRKLRRGEESE